MYNVTHHKPFGLILTALNEVHRHIDFMHDDFFSLVLTLVHHTVCFPGLLPLHYFLQEFLHDLILGTTFLILLTYFVKASI